ncbi:virion structural protein [Pseudomonas phage Phabio]|uniref:Virion structural protein n=1 Tax=Pseudomonas phage Phabio TaxID=2006668 RepID=A0A1Y0SYV1_9CAUD|nr:virion structural protein [Pseudomonas phage Phabio]ARV76836.1 virion structural protein [Pseudomonas phage Phabio]
MSDVIVQLPLDRTGRSPDNLISGEEHTLEVTPGFPYRIITLEHGGFYVKGLRVYDANYKQLKANTDYIVTYVYKNASESTGLDICGAIVFLDQQRTGTVFTSAQMVGGDLCYSFTVVEDYVKYFKSQPINYIPFWMDYVGNEPLWKPGELAQERWHLDTYQPFNNAVEELTVTVEGGDGTEEDELRKKIDEDYKKFLELFNDRLDLHIQDMSNPHVDVKSHQAIGLNLLENYRVATEAEAIEAVKNDVYLTPYLSGLTMDEWALKPLRLHIARTDNPHNVTIEQTGSNTKLQVNQLAESKYGVEETVANATYGWWNDQEWSYERLYEYIRRDIPAQNFSVGGQNGYMNPLRLGYGQPSDKKVLLSNQVWTDFDSLTTTFVDTVSPQINVLDAKIFANQTEAHNLVLVQPWAWTVPTGSMAFYRCNYSAWWGLGNGATVYTWAMTYCSIKTDAGWVAV